MSRSSDLLNLQGALGAALFSRKGLLEEYAGSFPEEMAKSMASLCSSLKLSMEMQGYLLDRMVEKEGWQSAYGEILWGPEKCVVIVWDSACIFEPQQGTSFNHIVDTMRKSAGVKINSTDKRD